jgi:flagellar FliL protein
MSEEAKSEPKKKGKGKLIVLLIVGLLLLGGGGGGAYWFWFRAPASAEGAEGGEKKEAAETDVGIVPLEQFLVNLADPGGTRFLRVTMRLVVEGEDNAAEIAENEVQIAQVRSAILELLTVQMSEKLVTPEGKDALKKEIVHRASEILHEVPVKDVLFSDFVVQF